MKLVLDASAAMKWYDRDVDLVKALKLRFDFHSQVHELLAPDTLLLVCADALAQAERKNIIGPGESHLSFADLVAIGIQLHPSIPLMPRAPADSRQGRWRLLP